MKIRLSVIIPGYNTPESWWRRCVDSVKMALGPNDEIILVDDGSAGGAKFLDAWGYRVVHKQNGGLASARNAGMAVARGEFVTFVDSDDEVLPEAFSRCLKKLSEASGDVCFYGVRTAWCDDGLQKVDESDDRVYGKLTAQVVYDLSKRCLMNYACNKVYRADFLRNHKIVFDLDGMPCEDIIYNLECVMAGANWCSVAYVGYVYYRTRGTLLSKYKRTGFVGIRHGAEAWQRFMASCEDVADTKVKRWLKAKGSLTDDGLALIEWRNIWMPASPYSLTGRWNWLRENPSVGGVMTFVKMAVYMFLRRHFYWRPVRRWNIRRLYPYATEWRSRVEVRPVL